MVKSKKFSKGAIIILLIALVLAFALIGGMTGAWANDPDRNREEIDFGIIDISLVNEEGDDLISVMMTDNADNILPGDYIATVNAGFINRSDLAIKYGYELRVEVRTYTKDVSDYFEITGVISSALISQTYALPSLISFSANSYI